MPPHFTAESLRFLKELKKHNDRAWFTQNKQRYEEHVKAPAEAFAGEVATKLGLEPHVMRIHRDIRFSKDKSPYKTNVGIGFSTGGRVTEGRPGCYLHVEPGECFAAVGMWQPPPPALAKIRAAIAEEPAAWAKARKNGLDDDSDALKRPPRGFDPEHKFIDDIKRRSFTVGANLPDAVVTKADLPARYVRIVRKLAPLNDFLDAALRA